MTAPSVVLSYGLGVDSTAILLRWINEPTCRDFDLGDLVVMTAMTGDEWPITGRLVERYVLPLLANRSIRYVQVARRGPSHRDGVAILDDSTSPTKLHLSGAYKLSQEMFAAGTIPQLGGARLCSAKAKGWPLDTARAQITAGRPYRHVMGFELGELARAAKDRTYNTEARTGEYPLIAWEWDRADAERYILNQLGVRWPKSACVYCPFALQNRTSRAHTLDRFAADPDAASLALLMEHVATAINPNQGLMAGDRLADLIAKAPKQAATIASLKQRIDQHPHAIYEVRRVLRPRKDDPTRLANAVRCLTAVAVGDPATMHAELAAIANRHATTITTDDQHERVWIRRRDGELPDIEHYYVTAPAIVSDKVGPGFDQAWEAAAAEVTSRPVQHGLF